MQQRQGKEEIVGEENRGKVERKWGVKKTSIKWNLTLWKLNKIYEINLRKGRGGQQPGGTKCSLEQSW